ncbi:LysR family transcriptional regulator [Vibrio tritonius]|uniref:LysR family transcriptional regulator n=1 Tax=Vibrio tritonius TaxID=1435069 RepID=UPI00315C9CEC
MDKIETIRRFIAVSQAGSFTKASDQLNLPKSAISTSISQLEQYLKTRLLHRSTRQVTLTEAGERFLLQSRQLLEELDELERQFQHESQDLTGLIKVDMPSRLFSTLIAPNLPAWFALHPHTQIRLIGADHRIDPIKERVDCVIRGGKLNDSNLIAKGLGQLDMVNCVSPSYIAKHGAPTSLADLNRHFVVDYSPDERQTQLGFEYQEGATPRYVAMPSLISVSTTDAYLAACLNGLGIIQVPRQGVAHHLERRELTEVLPSFRCVNMPMSVLYESRRQQPRRVSVFIEWLVSLFDQSREHLI